MRAGMTEIVNEFRALVSEAGTAIFTDDAIETILDRNRNIISVMPLSRLPIRENNQTVYKTYVFPSGGYLEGTVSGTAVVRVTNSAGSVISGYTLDSDQGIFTFASDTGGTAYYLTGNQFDLYKSVSDGWKQKAGYYAGNFDFSLEGRSYKKSQVIQSCLTMATHFEGLAKPVYGEIYRSDFLL